MTKFVTNVDEQLLPAADIEQVIQEWWQKKNPGAEDIDLRADGLLSRVYIVVHYKEAIPDNGGNKTRGN